MAGLVALPIMAKIAAAASIASTVVSAGAAHSQGKSQQKIAEYNAQQIEAKGKAEQAEAIQEAKNEARKRDLMLSRARAVGAASGGGIDIDLMGDIAEEGELNKQTIIWSGEEARAGRSAQAATARFEGKQRRRASAFDTGSTLLSGGQSFYEAYG